LYAYLNYPVRATCSAHIILFYVLSIYLFVNFSLVDGFSASWSDKRLKNLVFLCYEN
jgi:hypothetical protein